ncbi:MAG TPA: hypothetical protein VNZ26_35700 [Vicinamibacterales bacterium]|nr:hypothetical protein [Vicinamibacterales bacterium]
MLEPGQHHRTPWHGVGSGGVRVIYYWLSADHQIRLLMIYPKSRKDDLSTAEKAALRKIVEKWNG